MSNLAEFESWVKQFSAAEKRFITLIGKARAGSGGSDIIHLWNWVLTHNAGEELPANLRQHQTTYLRRLKELVLDGLRMLDQQRSPHSRMLKHLQAAQVLLEKGLTGSARIQCESALQLAEEFCRPEIQLQCHAFLRRMERDRDEADPFAALQFRSAQESRSLRKLTDLVWLRTAYDELTAAGSSAFSGRTSYLESKVREVDFMPKLKRFWEKGDWLERSLAGNMLGIVEIFEQKYPAAIARYGTLLPEWGSFPDRQKEEINLFLNLCKNYQNACFHVVIRTEERIALLARIPDFQGMPSLFKTKHQYLLLRERLALVLSNAQFEMLSTMAPEILGWLKTHWDALAESRALALSFNLAAAEFIRGKHREALAILTLILAKGKKSARKDIRDFCIVFQAVLHFELGNDDLNEYLIRSAKRRFSKHSNTDQFELAVLRCLTSCSQAKAKKARLLAFGKLLKDLAALEGKLSSRLQVVGLAELMIWCESKIQGKTLLEVYKDTMEAVGKAEAEVES